MFPPTDSEDVRFESDIHQNASYDMAWPMSNKGQSAQININTTDHTQVSPPDKPDTRMNINNEFSLPRLPNVTEEAAEFFHEWIWALKQENPWTNLHTRRPTSESLVWVMSDILKLPYTYTRYLQALTVCMRDTVCFFDDEKSIYDLLNCFAHELAGTPYSMKAQVEEAKKDEQGSSSEADAKSSGSEYQTAEKEQDDAFYTQQLSSLDTNTYPGTRKVSASAFCVGQVGWHLIADAAQNPNSPGIISTPKGDLIVKRYPVVIINKMDDGAEVLIMGSAGGNGLTYKQQSVKDRSMYVVLEHKRPKYNDSPKRTLEVASESVFRPSPGTFIDLSNRKKIHFDSTFVPQGSLTKTSIEDLAAEIVHFSMYTFYKTAQGAEALLNRMMASCKADHLLESTIISASGPPTQNSFSTGPPKKRGYDETLLRSDHEKHTHARQISYAQSRQSSSLSTVNGRLPARPSHPQFKQNCRLQTGNDHLPARPGAHSQSGNSSRLPTRNGCLPARPCGGGGGRCSIQQGRTCPPVPKFY